MLLSDHINQDVPLVKKGWRERYFVGKAHDSLVVDNERGKWNWHSKGLWGDLYDWGVFWRHLTPSDAYSLSHASEGASAVRAKVDLEPLDKQEFLHYNNVLLNSESGMKDMLRFRGLDRDTVAALKIGLTDRGNIISLPNIGPDGKMYSARFRAIKPWKDEFKNEWRYWSKKGSHPLYPYGYANLKGRKTLFIVEGEFKAAVVIQLGFDCIGTTSSGFMSSWKSYTDMYQRVVVLRDSYELTGVSFCHRIKQVCVHPDMTYVGTPQGYKAIDDYYRSYPEEAQAMLEGLDDFTGASWKPHS